MLVCTSSFADRFLSLSGRTASCSWACTSTASAPGPTSRRTCCPRENRTSFRSGVLTLTHAYCDSHIRIFPKQWCSPITSCPNVSLVCGLKIPLPVPTKNDTDTPPHTHTNTYTHILARHFPPLPRLFRLLALSRYKNRSTVGGDDILSCYRVLAQQQMFDWCTEVRALSIVLLLLVLSFGTATRAYGLCGGCVRRKRRL